MNSVSYVKILMNRLGLEHYDAYCMKRLDIAYLKECHSGAAVNIHFDDRCALYLQVLEDLWEVDAGLNGDLTYLGADLSRTSLSDSERAAVAWAFAGRHGGELVTGTWEELAEQGYIDRENLYWEDGVLFSITEKEEPVYFMPEGMAAVTFDAQKWRSGLGAYSFCDCTSVQSANGHWDGYSIGSEAIS